MRGDMYQREEMVIIILWQHPHSFQALLIVHRHINLFAAKFSSGPNEPCATFRAS